MCAGGTTGECAASSGRQYDQRLVTAGADGAVYEWRLQDFKREKENVLKVSPTPIPASHIWTDRWGSAGVYREMHVSACLYFDAFRATRLTSSGQ